MSFFCLIGLLLCAAPADAGPEVIPGQFSLDRQPDGNSVIFEDAHGLIVVDTGRHKEHQARILDFAKTHHKPIVGIVNTHWHLDHSGGNQELRAAYPHAKLYASRAVEGALQGFLARSLERGKARLADPTVRAEEKAETRLGVDAISDRRDLIPDMPITGTTRIPFRGGALELHLAGPAATKGDVWLYDPASRTLVAGDLVVIPAPFFDTACTEGWRHALDDLAKAPFARLLPGHGPTLDRAQFETWRHAYDALADCAAGSDPKQRCIDGWKRDAAALLPAAADRDAAQALLDYYFDNVLRSPAKQAEFCAAMP